MIMSLTNVLLLVLLLIMLPVLLINELIFDPFSGPIIHYHSLVLLEYKRKIVRKVDRNIFAQQHIASSILRKQAIIIIHKYFSCLRPFALFQYCAQFCLQISI